MFVDCSIGSHLKLAYLVVVIDCPIESITTPPVDLSCLPHDGGAAS